MIKAGNIKAEAYRCGNDVRFRISPLEIENIKENKHKYYDLLVNRLKTRAKNTVNID